MREEEEERGVPALPPVSQESEFVRFLREILDDPEARPPQEVKNAFWGYHTKESAVSNINQRDFEILVWKYRATEAWGLLSLPPRSLTFPQAMDLDNSFARVYLKLKRSVNGFERRMQVSQISVTQTVQQRIGKSVGFLGRLLGRKPEGGEVSE